MSSDHSVKYAYKLDSTRHALEKTCFNSHHRDKPGRDVGSADRLAQHDHITEQVSNRAIPPYLFHPSVPVQARRTSSRPARSAMLSWSLLALLKRGYKGVQGVGLQPKNLADWLLKSIDLKIIQNVKARLVRNKISAWKLGKSSKQEVASSGSITIANPGDQHASWARQCNTSPEES
eukprot:1151580-Pelagomonas_calceolata.AAC.1